MSGGSITFIGSGEFAPGMGATYREILEHHGRAARGIFLDTPAGFELNADAITQRAVDYFNQRVGVELDVASLRTAAIPADGVAHAVAQIEASDFTFAGPGSPTYAARVWRALGMGAVLGRRLETGGHLFFASAAAIAASCCALPVYEIYKVGQDPFWGEGLDLLGPFGLALAVVPHWNNTEGGTHDTAYCYMGAARFAKLEAQLPASTVVLGLDEYTACTLDLQRRTVEVTGAGGVTLRYRADGDEVVRERRHESGETFAAEELTPAGGELALPVPLTEQALAPAPAEPEPAQGDLAPLIDLLVSLRAKLRAGKQWALADEIRTRLDELGVRLEDTPEGTHWSR